MSPRPSMPSLTRARLRALGATALAAALVVACHDLPTSPKLKDDIGAGHLAVYAQIGGNLGALVLQVTGPGIVKNTGGPDTLVFNIPITNGVATGSVQVPVGLARTFTARVYDGITETHRGAVTVDVAQGANPTVSITLIPFIGTTPITVSLGTTIVIVSPSARTLDIGDTLRLTSQVIDQNGYILGGGVVRWASLNPTRAQVDTLGLVTVRDTGEALIVATYGTVGGAAKIRGTSHVSNNSYYLTWNGRTSQNWTDTTNWTPHGVGTARVPTGSDSVVIAASAQRMPRLNGCAQAAARDLVVEAGATLDYQCGPSVGITVTRSVANKGVVNADVKLLRTATIAGAFSRLIVAGDSVRLTDTTSATSITINGQGAELRLAGKKLTASGQVSASLGSRILLGGGTLNVGGSLTLNDSSWVEMTNAADTLNVRVSLDFGSKDTRTGALLSAGTLRVGGSLYANARFSYAVSGSLQTIIDGTGYQSMQVDSAALDLGAWPNVTVRNPTHVVFTSYAGNDSIGLTNFKMDTLAGAVDFNAYSRRWAMTPAGGTLLLTDTLSINYYGTLRVNGAVTLRSRPAVVGNPAPPRAALAGYNYYNAGLIITGVLTTDTASAVITRDVTLMDASGTANVSGRFSPNILRLTALQPTLKAGLPYGGLDLVGVRTGVVLTGNTTLTGDLTLEGGSRLALNGHTLSVATQMTVSDTSWVEMTNAVDTLNVRGDVVFSSKDTRGLLTAGTFRVGRSFTARFRFGFAASGTHQTIFDGTTYQGIQVDSAALNLGNWPNVTVRNPFHVDFSNYNGNDSIALPNFQLDTLAGAINFTAYNRRWGITPAGGTLVLTDTLSSNYYGYVRINGAVTMRGRPAVVGNPAPPRPMLTGYNYYNNGIIITGILTADTASVVDVRTLTLDSPSGTANVSGRFSPNTLRLTALQPTVKPGLAYVGLELNGVRTGVTLTGGTTFTGDVTLNNGSRLAIGGRTMRVAGFMDMNDSSFVEMTNAADTLNVRGTLTFGSKDTRTGNLLSAGTLLVGGAFNAINRFSFAPTSAHRTIIDGTTSQTIRVDSAALDLGSWPNLTIRNPSRVSLTSQAGNDSIALPNFQLDTLAGALDFTAYNRRWSVTPAGGTLILTDTLYNNYYGTVNIIGAVVMRGRPMVIGNPAPARPALSGYNYNYNAGIVITGALSGDTSSVVDSRDLTLKDATGTANIGSSHFSPTTLHLAALTSTLRPGLPYKGIDLIGVRSGVTLTGPTSASAAVTLKNGSRLVLGGQALTVASDLTMSDSSWVEMTNAADTLNVRNDLTFGSKDARTGGLLSAGVVRVGRYLNASGNGSYAMSGTHTTILDGASQQYAEVDSSALNQGVWNNLVIRNPARVTLTNRALSSDSIRLTNFQLDTLAGAIEFRSYQRRWAVEPLGGTLTVTDTLYPGYYGSVRVVGALTLRSRPTIVGNPAPPLAYLRNYAGSTLLVSGIMTADAASRVDVGKIVLEDASGTANVSGAFSPGNVTFTAASVTVKGTLGYQALTVLGVATVVGAPMRVNGLFNVGDATHGTASITVPDSTTFGSTVSVFGTLNFAARAFGTTQLLQIEANGTARAQGTTAGHFVDFQNIYNQNTGGTLDNTVANPGGRGFRRSTTGQYYVAGRTNATLGPIPGTF